MMYANIAVLRSPKNWGNNDNNANFNKHSSGAFFLFNFLDFNLFHIHACMSK